MILIRDYILKYVYLLTPEHIKKYALVNDINVSDEECNIICDFIINNINELLTDESILLKLKPKIRDSLYSNVLDLYQKNKTKFLS